MGKAIHSTYRAEGGGVVHKWIGLGTEEGAESPVPLPNASSVVVQMCGHFGGAVVALEGSIDREADHWCVLTNTAFGDRLAFSNPGMGVAAEHPLYVRPVVTAANPDAEITLLILARS